MVCMNEYTIELLFDDETQKWYAQNDDIPILLEDFSLDTLINRVKLAVPEMLEINNLPRTGIYQHSACCSGIYFSLAPV